jgi:hypothetical protein
MSRTRKVAAILTLIVGCTQPEPAPASAGAAKGDSEGGAKNRDASICALVKQLATPTRRDSKDVNDFCSMLPQIRAEHPWAYQRTDECLTAAKTSMNMARCMVLFTDFVKEEDAKKAAP